MRAQFPTVNYAPTEALAWGARRRGPIFFGRLGTRRYAYLTGPEANEFVFAHDDILRVGEAFTGLVPVDGPTSVVVTDGPEHARRRALIRPALHHRQVDGYVEIMVRCADEAIAAIAPGEPVDGYAVFRAAIRRATLLSLFGERIAEHADRIGAQLQPVLDLVDRIPELVLVHERLRTPLWRKAMRANAPVDEFIPGEITRLRAAPDSADSQVLATLVHGRDGSGSGLSDAEVRDQVMTLIAAGYETTSAAMAWTLYGVGGSREVMDRAVAEVAEVLGGRPPAAADVPRLVYLNAVVAEALRLYPPATILGRYAAESFEFGGRRVRAGDFVLISPYVTHRLPELHDAPREFRPQRWLGPQARRPPSEYLPFGGGAHRCIGSALASTELVVMLARVLARGAFRLESQRVRATGFAAMRPRKGVRLTLAS